MKSAAAPELSVVVAIVSDTISRRPDSGHLEGCLEHLMPQANDGQVELIVACLEGTEGIERLRSRFADVKFIAVPEALLERHVGGREHHDVLRARGLLAARGKLVALLEDHARPAADWCRSVIAAHRQPYAAIGGAIENGIDRPLNWAVYFCDFGRYQNPLPAGEAAFASDANVSYKREALFGIEAAWRESFREVVVHSALAARGEKVALSSEVVVYQHRQRLTLRAALQERYVWGRSYAATRNRLLSRWRRWVYALCSPALPVLLVGRGAATAWKRRRRLGKFLGALPYIVLLQTAWGLGEMVGYLVGVPIAGREGLR
ncbi:MAG: hypothetical protein K6T86_13390 [Pirellulales bacterium]|nr:hypothetical protein [Pirellulales bacterium]